MKGDPEFGIICFKWNSIAFRLGVPGMTLRRWCDEAGIKLPHWNDLRREPVWIPKEQLGLLLRLLLRSRVRRKVLAELRRKKMPTLEL